MACHCEGHDAKLGVQDVGLHESLSRWLENNNPLIWVDASCDRPGMSRFLVDNANFCYSAGVLQSSISPFGSFAAAEPRTLTGESSSKTKRRESSASNVKDGLTATRSGV